MRAHQASYAVDMLCPVLEVSTSGYYAWLKRTPSLRDRQNAVLSRQIEIFHKRSQETYGRPRIHAEPQEPGVKVGQKGVGR